MFSTTCAQVPLLLQTTVSKPALQEHLQLWSESSHKPTRLQSEDDRRQSPMFSKNCESLSAPLRTPTHRHSNKFAQTLQKPLSPQSLLMQSSTFLHVSMNLKKKTKNYIREGTAVSRAYRQPIWSLLECAAHGRSSQWDPRRHKCDHSNERLLVSPCPDKRRAIHTSNRHCCDTRLELRKFRSNCIAPSRHCCLPQRDPC